MGSGGVARGVGQVQRGRRGCGEGRWASHRKCIGSAGQPPNRIENRIAKSYRLEPSFSAFVVFQAIRFGDTIFDTIWGLPVSIGTISDTTMAQPRRTDTISDTIPAQPRRTDTISDTIPAQPRRTDMISDTIPAQPRQMDTISRFWQGWGGVGVG